ncbi:MAG: AhpC/TSA family protein [Chitinophagales bacterium]|nr:AhpC/TSA family protein [Chitinophagales bacterium]
MNRIILFSALALIMACSSSTGNGDSNNAAATTENAGKNYVINGKIANAPNMPVFLDQYTISQQNQNVQTVQTGTDGSFTMKGSLAEKGLYIIRLNQNANWLVVLDGGTISLTADANNIYNYSVEGSPEAKAFTAFVTKAGQNQMLLNQLSNQYNQARYSGNSQEMVSVQQQYQAKYIESQSSVRSFIDSTKYPLLGIFGASILNIEENAEFLTSFVAKAEATLPGSSYVAELKQKVDVATRLAIGGAAPDFELKSPKGETLKLSSLKGKVVLLDFWASWCRPCRMENPNVVRLYDKYSGKGFEVFSVSLDKDMAKWVAAIQQDNLKWKSHGSNLMYWQEPVAKMYEVSSIPQTFLLDKEGRIIGKNLRGEALEQKLKELFGA